MWSPTHINVIVHRARNLVHKGKAGTNDCYVTMHLGKEKFQTSIKEKSQHPEWQEECDFPVSEQKSVLKLSVFHRNLLGRDDFLGHVAVPLDQFQVYERPKSRWYELKGKPGSSKPEKYRGELEVTVAFMVHSLSGSYAALNKSEKATKSLSIKSLAHTVGDKLNMKWPSKSNLSLKSGSRSDVSSGAFSAQSSSQKSLLDSNSPTDATKTLGSSKDQMSSLASLVELSEDSPDSVLPAEGSISSSVVPSPECRTFGGDAQGDRRAIDRNESEEGSGMTCREMKQNKVAADSTKMVSTEKLGDKFKRFKDGPAVKCHTLGHPGRNLPQVSAFEMHEMEEYKRTRRELQLTRNVLSGESLDRFSKYEKEDLMRMVVEMESEMSKKETYVRDLEDYIDNLLVKVIETQPKLLQNPYEQPSSHNSSAKKLSTFSAPPIVPPSSTMPPGIYVAKTAGERNAVTMINAPCTRKSNSVKSSKKPLIIASPFKKLQALIK